MLKYLLVSIVIAFIYRFWDSKPKKKASVQKPEPKIEYADYEEID